MPRKSRHKLVYPAPDAESLVLAADVHAAQKTKSALAEAEAEIYRLQKQNTLRGLYLVTIYEILFPDGATRDEETEHRLVCARIRHLQKIEHLARISIERKRDLLQSIDDALTVKPGVTVHAGITGDPFVADRALMHALDEQTSYNP